MFEGTVARVFAYIVYGVTSEFVGANEIRNSRALR